MDAPGPIRSLVVALEGIDIAITVTGTQAKTRRLYPDASFGPVTASLIAGFGAPVWRYIEMKCRGIEPTCPW